MLDTLWIGNRIRELRISRCLTQQEFAKKMNVSFQAVSAWERAIAPPDLGNLVEISSFFGVLLDDLVKNRGEKLVLGVDGGGTKTEFVLASYDGTVVERFTRACSNPNDLGMEKALKIIYDGIYDSIVRYPSIDSVFCGIAGAATSDNSKRMTEYLSEKFPNIKISVKTDSANLFAMEEEVDMAVISGTGSVVYVRRDDSYERLGGWGYLFDDAGSGYDVGREAVRISLSEEDEKLPESILCRKVKEKLNVKKIWDAVGRLYDGGRSAIASLASAVFEAYELNDSNAEKIIDKSAMRLAELLNLGVKLYGVRPRAVAGGGIFENHKEIVLQHVRKYTDAELVIHDVPQIYGACRIAAKAAGSIDPNFYDNFKKTYGDKIK